MRAPLASTRAAARVAVLTTIVASLTLGVVPTTSAAASPSAGSSPPIVFVHGYKPSPQPGFDLPVQPALLTQMAAKEGRTVIPIGYYMKDVNGPSVQQSGRPGAGYSSGKQKGGNTNQTDIRHLSYQLAWWIYDNHSSKGQPVDLIGHSMGGLIIRWMLYGLRTDPAWPPLLLVEDAVSVSTPHLGLPYLSTTGAGCVGTLQCNQLMEGSAFIKELGAKGRGPRATGGTDWTAIGAKTGDIASPAVLTDMGADHVTLVAKSGHADYFKVASSVQLMLDAVRSSSQ